MSDNSFKEVTPWPISDHLPVTIRRILIDVLKPREVSLVEFSTTLCKAGGVEQVDVVVREVDAMTETIRLTLTGPSIRYEEVTKVLKEQGMAVRGIDEITVARPKRADTQPGTARGT